MIKISNLRKRSLMLWRARLYDVSHVWTDEDETQGIVPSYLHIDLLIRLHYTTLSNLRTSSTALKFQSTLRDMRLVHNFLAFTVEYE